MRKKYEESLNNYRELLREEHSSFPLQEMFLRLDEFENSSAYDVSFRVGNPASDKLYIHTNERNFNLFKHVLVNGGKVLTVGSSGDQALNSLLFGAKEVTIIDLNMYTKYFVELKIALIKSLNFHEFCDYTNNFPKNFFEKFDVYAKVSHRLSPETQNFWDTLMVDGREEMLVNLFHGFNIDVGEAYFNNEQIYHKLKNRLLKNDFKLNFITEDISWFAEATTEQYDLVMLSNIMDYCVWSMEDKKMFMNTVAKLFNNNLSKGGVIQINSAGPWFISKPANDKYKKYLKERVKKIKIFTLKNCGMGIRDTGLYVKKRGKLKLKKMTEQEREY